METLYRKVAVSERLPKDFGFYFIISVNGVQKNYWFNGTKFFIDENVTVKFWLEEIPDNSHQIENLEADKAELLESLEKVTDLLEAGFPEISAVKESKSLIQKYKC